MKPNAKQQEAIGYLEGPLLVLAGPGTGKTQLLSEKVAYILRKTDTAPENILCLTYTENATLNMRDRLIEIVGADAHKVNIHTYHAFGVTLLQQYQQYNPQFTRSLDDMIDEVTQFKIVNDIINKLPNDDILRHHSNQITNLGDIVQTIGEAKAACLTADDLMKIAECNLEETAKINAALTPILAKVVPRMPLDKALAEVYEPAGAELAKFTSSTPIVKQIEREANTIARDLHDAIDEAQNGEKPRLTPLTDWKRKYFELDGDGNHRLKNIVATKKLISLANIMAQYQEYLEKSGLYDYADMIQLAIEFLADDRGFRLTMSERYQYILLDEFQDTNPSQFQLVKHLTDYENPQVMAVGDDDQAICEFQGANASNLIDFQNYYKAKTIVLEENYRSTQDILDLSRHVADQIEDSFAKKHRINKKLIAKTATGQIARHQFVSSDAEYAWVAQQIAELVKQGTKQSEIAVIAPKHKLLLPILPYFERYKKVNITYEKHDDIFTDPRIAQLLKLAHFVYDLSQEKNPAHNWLEILSFPFWQIPSTAALATVHEKSGLKTLDYFLKSKDEQIQKTANFIGRLVQLSYDSPLELMIDYMLGVIETPNDKQKSPFLDFYKDQGSDYAVFELYEHLSVLLNAVKKHTRNNNARLADLITCHDDYVFANHPLYSTSPYHLDDNSVQLMSVHKAKGLEFKHVFLISADNQSWGKSAGNNNTFVLPKNLIEIRHTGQTEDEHLRLLFVAMTRAKTDLTFTSAEADFTGKPRLPLAYLIGTEDKVPIATHEPGNDLDNLAANLQTHWLSAYYHTEPELRALLKKRVENYKITATDLTTFIDIQYSGPMTFFEQKILKAPSEPQSINLTLGNVIHAVFEKITKQHLSDEEAMKFFEERLKEENLLPADYDWLHTKGINTLKAALPKFGDLLRSDHAVAELDFHSEHLQIDNMQITGKIDHLQIDKANKTITVYDFKTSKHHKPGPKAGWKTDTALFKYGLQLEFYKLLLMTSPQYRGYQINEGHILFVAPDEEGNVTDETYQFTDKSHEEFFQLLTKVYGHITSLDFLDDPKLALHSDDNRGKKEVFDFAKLLSE